MRRTQGRSGRTGPSRVISSPGRQTRPRQLRPLSGQIRSRWLTPPRCSRSCSHSRSRASSTLSPPSPPALPLPAKPLRSRSRCYVSMATTEFPMRCEVRPRLLGSSDSDPLAPSSETPFSGQPRALLSRGPPSSPHAPPGPHYSPPDPSPALGSREPRFPVPL